MKTVLMRWITIIHLSVLFVACERSPLFNFIGVETRDSESFVINPCMSLDDIERVDSIYGTPFAAADSSIHKGIDIGGDEMAGREK